jgi:2-polyprenyl-3-methyl-5-hydroxy-6-metoxy-1,4-benzoquinol methylase
MNQTTGAATRVEMDQAVSGAFLEHLKASYRGTVVTQMIELGHRHGLFDALAGGGCSSLALAEATSLSERHVREWLGAVTVGGITTYDPATGEYQLPAEHAFWITGTRYTNLAPMAGMLNGLGQRIDDVAEAFVHGGGVPYSQYRPHFTCAMDVIGRARYDALLVKVYLRKVDGLIPLLTEGVQVADVGCGTGHCVNLMAAAFPLSTFVGFDFSEEAIALARQEADEMGLRNATFELAEAVSVPEGFDVVFAFDAIHDQADPVGVLAAIRRAVKPGGHFVMLDINASSNLEDNVGDPSKVILYATSVMHCMEVSLAGGGPGLGTVWGHQLATEMLTTAGFTTITRSDLEGDPTNCLYACH